MCRHADNIDGSTNATRGREVLPTNVKPVHYDLTLEPDFEKFTYEGTVVIEYVWEKPVTFSTFFCFFVEAARIEADW
jgi:hypothetical protein